MFTSQSTDLVRKESIEELVGHRQRAIELYTLLVNTFVQAGEAHQRACGGYKYIDQDFLKDMRYGPRGESLGKASKKAIDRDMWRFIMKATNLDSLMDDTAKKEFEKDLEKDPPECTVENVLATVQNLMGQAHVIFRRGAVTAFQRLSSSHKSNDGFKIGPRAIWTSGVTYHKDWGFRMNHYRENEIADIDRCFYVLDGKSPPEYQQGIGAAMRSNMDHHKPYKTTAETEYMTAKWHQNGTVHLVFKRPDLLEKINKLIAEHYGEQLGAGHSARHAT